MGRLHAWFKLYQHEDGLVLPIVLVLLVLGILLIAPTLGLGQTSLEATNVAETKFEELHAADAGIEAGIHHLKSGGEGYEVDLFDLNGCGVDVTITPEGENEEGVPAYRIQSVASGLRESSSTTVNALVSGIPFQSMEDDPYWADKITPSGNILGGVVEEGEYYTLDQDIESVGGGFTIYGTVVFHGTVDRFTGNSLVDGTAVFCEHVGSFIGSTESSGTVIFCDGLDAYTGSSSTNFNLVVVGDLWVDGNADLQGNSTVFGNVDGSGSNSISGSLCYTGTITDDVHVEPGTTISYDCGDPSDYCYRCNPGYGDFEIRYYEID